MSADLRAAADRARARLVELVDELAGELDPAAIRDRAIGVAVLSDGIEKLDELAGRELVDVAVLERWRDSVRAVLEQLAGRAGEDLHGGSFRFDQQGPIIVDRGHGEPGQITERMFWNLLEGTLDELEHRTGTR